MAIVSPRAQAALKGKQSAPIDWYDEKEHRRKLAEVLNDVQRGKVTSVNEITLTANQVTTTLDDDKIGIESYVQFMALTANAAAEQASGGMYVSAQTNRQVTITHANNAQTDRDFRYVILG